MNDNIKQLYLAMYMKKEEVQLLIYINVRLNHIIYNLLKNHMVDFETEEAKILIKRLYNLPTAHTASSSFGLYHTKPIFIYYEEILRALNIK